MELQLNGHTALVTGAGRGIGLAATRSLLAEGVDVLAVTRSPTAELSGSGARTVIADLTTHDGLAAVSAACEDRPPTLLVNNAGGGSSEDATPPFLEIDDAHWQRMLDLNLLAAVRVTRIVLPGMLHRGGVVVNVSSIGAWQPAGPPLAYNVAKAALRAFSKGLADEVGPAGVRVVTVTPGPTRTDVWESSDSLGAAFAHAAGVPHETFLTQVPAMLGMTTGRLAEPGEVASLITFLLSPLAASITGSDHRVDGGAVRIA